MLGLSRILYTKLEKPCNLQGFLFLEGVLFCKFLRDVAVKLYMTSVLLTKIVDRIGC